MLRLIKYELLYRKDLFLYVMLGAGIIGLLLENWHILNRNYQPGGKTHLFLLLYFFFSWVAIFFNNTRIKENRERFISLLPISIRVRAISRALVELVTWLIMISLFLLYCLFVKDAPINPALLRSIAATSGIAFIIYALGFFFTDLLIPPPPPYCNSITYKVIANLLKSVIPISALFLSVIQMIAVMHMFRYNQDFYYKLYQGGGESTALELLGLVLFLCTIPIYLKRRDFAG